MTTTSKRSRSALRKKILSNVTHLRMLKRGFEPGILNTETIENVDEIHFVRYFDNGKTLGFAEKNALRTQTLYLVEKT